MDFFITGIGTGFALYTFFSLIGYALRSILEFFKS